MGEDLFFQEWQLNKSVPVFVSLIDPTRNLYRIAVSASSCGAADGSYTGLASVTDGTRVNDTLLFSASNPTRVMFGALGRT